MTSLRQSQFIARVEDLVGEYGPEYVMAALKQINDQQLLYISFKGYRIPDDPVLKIYEQVVQEIEQVVFDRSGDTFSEERLRRMITAARDRVTTLADSGTA